MPGLHRTLQKEKMKKRKKKKNHLAPLKRKASPWIWKEQIMWIPVPSCLLWGAEQDVCNTQLESQIIGTDHDVGNWSQNSCQPAAVLVTGQTVCECSSENLTLCWNRSVRTMTLHTCHRQQRSGPHLFYLLGWLLQASVKAATHFCGNPGEVPFLPLQCQTG